MTRTYDVTIGGVVRKVSITREGDGAATGLNYRISIDGGQPRLVNAVRPVPDVLTLLVDRRSWEAGLVPTEQGFDVEILGVRHTLEVADPRRKALRMAAGSEAALVRSPMPGRVVRVLVGAGESVKKGQPLVVVEAMKMENELKSPKDGVVRKLAVAPGALVEARATLVELE